MIIEIESIADPRLDDYLRLTDVALRKKLEATHGLYISEGAKVIERSLQAGHHPRSFMVSPKWLDSVREILRSRPDSSDDGGSTPIFVVPELLMEELTGFHVHRGALAAFDRAALADPLEIVGPQSSARRIVVLENLVNHTNVGAVFRSVAALGFDAVLVTDSCADPLYRRSVRVSMGTVFQVPWTRLSNWPNSLDLLKENGWVTASLALNDRALSLDEFSSLPCVTEEGSRVALILGTEGDGLSDATISRADYSVVIPMAGGVDSLNVAAAGAVAAWELRVR